MRKLLYFSILAILLGAISSTVSAQNMKPTVISGEVTTISDSRIAVQTRDGAVEAQISGTTKFKKVSPTDTTVRTDSSLADIGVGDKIAVQGILSDDKKTIPAAAVYLMTKADITSRNTAEQQAWRTRSISGRVVAVNPAMQQFTVAARNATGEQNVVVTPKLNIHYRRYAPDSVKFDDAKESSFAEIKVGDQVRVLGDKSDDGTSFRAERVVAGSFTTIAGTITQIDAANNRVTIKDIKTGKPVTVTVNGSSVLKQFPAEFAQMMSMRMQGGTGGGAPMGGGQGGTVTMRPPQGSGQPGGQTTPNGMGGQGGQGGGMRGGRGEFDDMLDRFPTITLADLKVGEAIAFSSSTGTDATKATAIKLVAGVEPFLRAGQTGGGRRNGGGGQDSGFSIPGLDDGIGAP